MASPISKPHMVLVPYPAQGHINPLLKLAKLLHSSYNFHITFVNSEFNHRRLLNSLGFPATTIPDFQFRTIPDGLPPSDDNATQDIPSLSYSLMNNCLVPFKELLVSLGSEGTPVSCVITDGVMSFGLDAASQLGIPGVAFWTMSACGMLCYFHFHQLVETGLIPLRDMSDITNGYLDTPIEWIPGMKNMRLKDIPSFIRTADLGDIMLNFYLHETRKSYTTASAIIINTFSDFERPVLDALSDILSLPIYTIGPLNLLTRHLPSDTPVANLGSSLWKEQTNCLTWLDDKQVDSVVLVNFGSITTMTSQNLGEFAWGLANSNTNFLWVIRPDLVKGDAAILPREFLSQIEGRGLLANWCNQEAVLMHPSVGGFLTHCGWNSTLESISGGVPTMCWPFFAEQQTNCRYLCTEWGIGAEIGGDVRREKVERVVRDMMEGENGKEMRRKAREWKEKAVRATERGGTSFVDLERVVKEVLAPTR